MSLDWRPRLSIYSNYNKKNTFDPKICEGRSYGHWVYVRQIKGKVVFNNYRYSNTTSKHQSEMLSLLRTLGIQVDFYISMRDGLNKFEEKALPAIYADIYNLKKEIEKPRSRKSKNEEREREIQSLLADAKVAESLGAKMTKAERKYAEELYKAGVEEMKEEDKTKKDNAQLLKDLKKKYPDINFNPFEKVGLDFSKIKFAKGKNSWLIDTEREQILYYPETDVFVGLPSRSDSSAGYHSADEAEQFLFPKKTPYPETFRMEDWSFHRVPPEHPVNGELMCALMTSGNGNATISKTIGEDSGGFHPILEAALSVSPSTVNLENNPYYFVTGLVINKNTERQVSLKGWHIAVPSEAKGSFLGNRYT